MFKQKIKIVYTSSTTNDLDGHFKKSNDTIYTGSYILDNAQWYDWSKYNSYSNIFFSILPNKWFWKPDRRIQKNIQKVVSVFYNR